MKMTLTAATFTFNTSQGQIKAICAIGTAPAVWALIFNDKVETYVETRTNQFVNQTRAKEVIEMFIIKPATVHSGK